VDKLVDLLSRIPIQLSLHFSHFSMIYYAISKFTGMDLKVHVYFLFFSPWNLARRTLELI